MLDYDLKNFANQNTVYSELHDMGGLDEEIRRKAFRFGASEMLTKEAEYYRFAEEHCK